MKSDSLRHFACAVGDFNECAIDEEPFDVLRPKMLTSGDIAVRRTAQRITKMFKDFVELACDEPTHYNREAGTMAKLDKCYFTAPAWRTEIMEMRVNIIHEADEISTSGISNHAVLVFCITS